MQRISPLLVAATKSSFHNHPSWQCWSKAAASLGHKAPLTRIAFQKIYGEPRTAATRVRVRRVKWTQLRRHQSCFFKHGRTQMVCSLVVLFWIDIYIKMTLLF